MWGKMIRILKLFHVSGFAILLGSILTFIIISALFNVNTNEVKL